MRARWYPLIALAALLGACEHPIGIVTAHVEAADIVVRDTAGATLARTRENRRWEGGPLRVPDGGALALAPVLLDFRERELDVLAARGDLELRAEAESPGVAAWEPLRGGGRWHGLAPGRTRVRFLVWHGTHADFVTPWLDLDVAPAAAP